MKTLLTLVFSIVVVKAMACVCAPLPDFKNKDDLKSYDFIALIDIKELAPVGNFGLRANGDIKINVVELFKGTVSTQAVDPSFNSSCALSLNEGEQWLFFGVRVNDKIQVGMCTYTIPYRDAKGAREWSYGKAINRLSTLRRLFEKPDISGLKNKIFYPDGKVEIEQVVKKGTLDGIRKIYYPSGKLYVEEKFKMGNRVEYRKIYSETGQPMINERYKNGSIVQYIYYHDTTRTVEQIAFKMTMAERMPTIEKTSVAEYRRMLDSLRRSPNWSKQISAIYNYSNDGKSYTRKFYDYDGKLIAETVMDWVSGVQNHKMYYANGKLRSDRTMDKVNDKEIEYDYKADGTSKEFIKKCESCKYHFDANELPSMPEPVYIQ